MRTSLCCLLLAVFLAGTGSAGTARPAGWVLYWSETPRPTIRAVRPNGTHDHRILRTRQNAKRPRLSPDRTWVAFDGAPPGKAAFSDFDIQLVRLDGRGLRTLTTTADWDTDAQWSPDGAWLSFTRSEPSPQGCRDSSIWIVRRDGSDARRIVPGCGARWSPDGAKLIYTAPSGHGLWVVDLASGTSRLLLATRAWVQVAGWSPDGKKILFTRSSDLSGRSGLVFVMKADGTRARRLARGFAGSWSPDGSKIVYTALFASPLLVMNANGSHKHRIGSVDASEPDWR